MLRVDTMCGIYFSCSRHHYVSPTTEETEYLKRRGPDSYNILPIKHDDYTNRETEQPDVPRDPYYMNFASSVLSLRGHQVIKQPLYDTTDSFILCWNGEAWKLHGDTVHGTDSSAIFDALCAASVVQTVDRADDSEGTLLAQIRVLSSCFGPYAFIFYDPRNCRVIFGRDVLGRRSLLLRQTFEQFCLSSVCHGSDSGNWKEVDANGVYILDLQSGRESGLTLHHVPWISTEESVLSGQQSVQKSLTERKYVADTL